MNFNINRILNGLQNPELFLKKPDAAAQNRISGFATEFNSNMQEGKLLANSGLLQNTQNITNLIQQNYHMNNFTLTDRSVFIKNLLGLPQNLSQILQAVQDPNKPIISGMLNLNNMNSEFAKTQKILSEIFDDTNSAQNVLNALNIQSQTTQIKQDAAALLFSGMISLSDVSKVILQNSKQAVAALIISMASAAKQGVNGKQIQDTLNVLNSCIYMAESDNPAQNLKSLMMLYLPWLPLNEGIGFDLEITTPDGENESNDSKLTVLIQTKNFGNLKGVFTLTTTNSVDVYIQCSEEFPKSILQKSLATEGTAHSMNTNIDIEEIKNINKEQKSEQETKVNLSATNEMNPYLLLMAHAFIRNTILIDNGAVCS